MSGSARNHPSSSISQNEPIRAQRKPTVVLTTRK
jgi:hypothetical protein